MVNNMYYQPLPKSKLFDVNEPNSENSENDDSIKQNDKKEWVPDKVNPEIDVMEITRQVVGREK